MVDLPGKLEAVLHANPGKNYCAGCLAKVADLTSPEGRFPVATLMRSTYSKLTDRKVENDICSVCGRTELVVQLL